MIIEENARFNINIVTNSRLLKHRFSSAKPMTAAVSSDITNQLLGSKEMRVPCGQAAFFWGGGISRLSQPCILESRLFLL